MNAKDLRIGNYIKYRKKLYFIIELQTEGCTIRKNSNYGKVAFVSYEEIIPIRLNASELIKLGFKCSHTEWHKEICITQRGLHFYYCVGKGVKPSEYIVHVHNLQNLHYALTKNELEREEKIKEKD